MRWLVTYTDIDDCDGAYWVTADAESIEDAERIVLAHLAEANNCAYGEVPFVLGLCLSLEEIERAMHGKADLPTASQA